MTICADKSIKILMFADDTIVSFPNMMRPITEKCYLATWCVSSNLELLVVKTVEMKVVFCHGLPAYLSLEFADQAILWSSISDSCGTQSPTHWAQQCDVQIISITKKKQKRLFVLCQLKKLSVSQCIPLMHCHYGEHLDILHHHLVTCCLHPLQDQVTTSGLVNWENHRLSAANIIRPVHSQGVGESWENCCCFHFPR